MFDFLARFLGPNEVHYCMGLEWLGTCNYDPALPSPTYFTLGNAIAALAFTLTVQNFLKPIYHFRLYARYLSLDKLYIMIFTAVLCSGVAAAVPSIHVLHGGPWGYAIVWEFLATGLFVLAYGAVALAVVRPIKVAEHRLDDFARGAARLLSAADEADHIDILPDIQRSLAKIIELARFFEGEPGSAFFNFIHRHKIEQASFAYTLLGLIADPTFCRTLVVKAPWATAGMLQVIGDQKIHARAAEKFVQELSLQAILAEESMLTRELDYHGFGTAPLLSESLFSDPFIVKRYNPMEIYVPSDRLTWSILMRFNGAAERVYLTLINERETHRSRVAYSISSFYRSAFSRAYLLQQDENYDYRHVMEIGHAVEHSIKLANKLMASLGSQSYDQLYARADEKHARHDVLQTLVETVFEALESIANRFNGFNDPFWHLAIELMHRGFNSIGEEPDGMTPFQQRLALKIVDKLRDNMHGYFPALSRVMLQMVGPFEEKGRQPNPTAFNILRQAVYAELQGLPQFGLENPEKVLKYLPASIVLDAEAGTITQSYSDGAQAVTDLRALKLETVNLYEAIKRPMTQEEIETTRYEYPDSRQ